MKCLPLLLFILLLCGFVSPEEKEALRPGKDYALFFAVDDYRPNAAFGNLANPIKDADAIAKELEEMFGFDTEVYKNPSRQKIFDVLRQWQGRSFAEDRQLFVFFSGHGTFDEFLKKGYFVPYGSDPRDNIDLTDLGNVVTSIPCNHTLLAIDACFSGTIDQAIAFKGDWKRPGATSQSEKDRVIERLLRNRSRLLITSGGKQRTPDGVGHSPFSNAILQGLKAAYAHTDGLFTYSDLLARLERVSPTPHYGELIGHDQGSFVFISSDKNSFSKAAPERYPSSNPSSSGALPPINSAGAFPPLTLHAQSSRKGSVTDRGGGRSITPGARLNSSTPSDNMIFVSGGTFQMGSNDGDDNEKPVYSVRVSDFYMGRYEVTFEEYDTFCTATGTELPYDMGWGRGKHPVMNVSWNDAVVYCNWLSEEHRYQPVYTIRGDQVTANWEANGYRLPTEAEWEYAARSRGGSDKWAGTSTESSLASFANFCDEECSQRWKTWDQNDGHSFTAPVGNLRANGLGIHDMSGNVCEWCWDWYGSDYYGKVERENPSGPAQGDSRVFRGGSWRSEASNCRAADRNGLTPMVGGNNIGFRLVRS